MHLAMLAHIASTSIGAIVIDTGLTCSKVGRLWGSTRGSEPEPTVKQVAQSAQAVAEVLQGNWSGGGHCAPWGSSLQQWGRPGLIQDRKSSSQLAGGLAMYVLPGSLAAALTYIAHSGSCL